MTTPSSDRSSNPAFIFDLDGTLVDTIADLTASVNHAIKPVRAVPHTPDAIRAMVGDGVGMLMREATGIDDQVTIDALVGRFREYYAAHYLDATRLYPGWRETLTALAARGASLAVLSNKPHEFTRRICAELLAPWPLVHVEGQQDGVPMKPDPTRALFICDLMGRRAAEVAFVGDSSHDIETARRAGMRAVSVTWGYRTREELTPHGPDCFVDHPSQLLTLHTSDR